MTERTGPRPWEQLWRRRLDAPPHPAQPTGFTGVRLGVAEAEASIDAGARQLALRRPCDQDAAFNVLAISGGAAGGAYGAGAMIGLSEAGRRPQFALVTGVSTGALIALFAFLGPAWDKLLAEAYTNGHAAELFGFARLSGVLDGGLLSTDSLDELIAPFVDEAMLDAIATEHRTGRRLLVGTTDLDTQQQAVWDMGEIACHGGEAAVRLFRVVLAASASLPGLFPPRVISCNYEGRDFEELHVDGGVSAPLFIIPQALLRGRDRLRGGTVYAIVNTVMNPSPSTTAITLLTVLMRSFDTMLRVSYRQALSVATTFCSAHDIPMSVATMEEEGAPAGNGAMLNFSTSAMRESFERGRRAGRAVDFWRALGPTDARPGGRRVADAAEIR